MLQFVAGRSWPTATATRRLRRHPGRGPHPAAADRRVPPAPARTGQPARPCGTDVRSVSSRRYVQRGQVPRLLPQRPWPAAAGPLPRRWRAAACRTVQAAGAEGRPGVVPRTCSVAGPRRRPPDRRPGWPSDGDAQGHGSSRAWSTLPASPAVGRWPPWPTPVGHPHAQPTARRSPFGHPGARASAHSRPPDHLAHLQVGVAPGPWPEERRLARAAHERPQHPRHLHGDEGVRHQPRGQHEPVPRVGAIRSRYARRSTTPAAATATANMPPLNRMADP